MQEGHRQWTFCNSTVHLRGPDGLTEAQREALARKCKDLLWTDPCNLLQDGRYLRDIDFTSPGDAPAATLQIWLSEMEATRCAARNNDGDDSTEGRLSDIHIPAPVDTEGTSIRFRRRCRRQSGVLEHLVCSISLMEEVTPYGPGNCSAYY